LQSYLERRLLGFTDFEATDALGSSNAQRLIDAAESWVLGQRWDEHLDGW
jgi:hypothetical protein